MFNARPSNVLVEGDDDSSAADRNLTDRAQIFFQRAKALDPNNIVVDSLVNMAQCLLQAPHAGPHEFDEEAMPDSPQTSRTKRLRVEQDIF